MVFHFRGFSSEICKDSQILQLFVSVDFKMKKNSIIVTENEKNIAFAS